MSYGAALAEGIGCCYSDDCETAHRASDAVDRLEKFHEAMLTVLHLERVSGVNGNQAVIQYVEKFLTSERWS